MYFSNLFGITSILHQIYQAHKKLNDCHNLLNSEILKELF